MNMREKGDEEGDVYGYGGEDKDESDEGTYAPGHILVNTNNGVLCSARRGFDGPKVLVKCNATSSDMYNVATKKATVKNKNG
jgi:hypothetical protein